MRGPLRLGGSERGREVKKSRYVMSRKGIEESGLSLYSYRTVSSFLTGMFPRPTIHFHMDTVDDVVEILHDSYPFVVSCSSSKRYILYTSSLGGF